MALLEKGADVQAKSNRGWKSLLLVSANGYFDIAIVLLEKGADAQAKDREGSTPLLRAS